MGAESFQRTFLSQCLKLQNLFNVGNCSFDQLGVPTDFLRRISKGFQIHHTLFSGNNVRGKEGETAFNLAQEDAMRDCVSALKCIGCALIENRVMLIHGVLTNGFEQSSWQCLFVG